MEFCLSAIKGDCAKQSAARECKQKIGDLIDYFLDCPDPSGIISASKATRICNGGKDVKVTPQP